jgi:hemoglobin-like flavoprotein
MFHRKAAPALLTDDEEVAWQIGQVEPEEDLQAMTEPTVEHVTVTHRALPDEDTLAYRIECDSCHGHGYVTATATDLLTSSLALIPDGGGDAVIGQFYANLMKAAPGLADLFPADLLIGAHGDPDSEGTAQRDKLYGALVALATLYNPANPDAMERLDTALAAHGRSHANFNRAREATVRGATPDEYVAVKAVLLATFHEVAGDAWSEVYDAVWDEAYNYAFSVMFYHQLRSGLTMPRYARESR